MAGERAVLFGERIVGAVQFSPEVVEFHFRLVGELRGGQSGEGIADSQLTTDARLRAFGYLDWFSGALRRFSEELALIVEEKAAQLRTLGRRSDFPDGNRTGFLLRLELGKLDIWRELLNCGCNLLGSRRAFYVVVMVGELASGEPFFAEDHLRVRVVVLVDLDRVRTAVLLVAFDGLRVCLFPVVANRLFARQFPPQEDDVGDDIRPRVLPECATR